MKQRVRMRLISAGILSLGLILSIVWSAILQAQTSPSPDPFSDDMRFAMKHSLRFQNASLRDFLADLNEQTGITFYADPTVKDDKITLITHDRPLVETLKAIARFYHWEWRRSGTKGKYGYTLLQLPEARREEDKQNTRRMEELVRLIEDEAKVYEAVSPLAQKQREDREESLPQQIATEMDGSKRRLLQIETIVLRDLQTTRRWKAVVYKFLRSLPHEQILGMVRSDATLYAWPSLPGTSEFPKPILEELQRAVMQDMSQNNAGRGEVVALRLRLTPVTARQLYLRLSLQIGQRSIYGFSNYGSNHMLPVSYALLNETAAPVPGAAPEEPVGWQNDPELTPSVNLNLLAEAAKPAAPPQNAAANEKPDKAVKPPAAKAETPDPDMPDPPFWRLSDALDQLDHQRPLNVIADGFWSTHLAGADLKQKPLGEVLTLLARTTTHRWWKEDGFIFLQSTRYGADRAAEPPATALARWREEADRGLTQLEDFAEIALLSEAQSITLQEMAMVGQFPVSLSPLGTIRSHLVLWNSLTPPQRRKALNGGLPYTEMTVPQQRFYILAATDPNSSPQSSDIPNEKLLSRARLRLENQEKKYWGVRRNGPLSTYRIPRSNDPDTGIASRDEAVTRFQQSQVGIRKSEVQPMTLALVLFYYETDNDTLARGYVQLPPRWEPGVD